MNNYELTFLMDAQLAPEKQEEVIAKFLELLKSKGAEVLNVERWGKRKLAYVIGDRQYAYYLITEFEAPPQAITEVEHFLKVNPSIFRYLVLHRDPRMLKMIHLETERRAHEAARLADLERIQALESEKPAVAEIVPEALIEPTDIVEGENEDVGPPEKE
jgi:small subunit ribosomal protein S6